MVGGRRGGYRAGVRAWREELRVQVRLAAPVALVQVGLMAMSVVDSMFMGRVSAVQFAATTIGHAWAFLWLALGFGTLNALDPVASQAYGARDHDALARALQRGLFLALVLTLPLAVPVLFAERVFVLLGQPEAVVPVAAGYARVTILGFPFFLAFVAQRTVLQAMHRLRPLVLVIVATNLLNAALDWVLIFGHLGAPALGAVGSAWGTACARACMAAGLALVAWPLLGPYLWPWRADSLRLRPILRLVRIGLPVGLQFVTEIGAFGLVAFLMGRLGAEQVAGHHVALTLASLSFMVPIGIAMAASVRVGNEIGAGRAEGARLAARVALALGAGVMVVSALLFLTLPGPLVRLFTDQPEVLPVAVALLPLAALFQVFDGTQAVAGGVLRGAADTRAPFLAHLGAFWACGVPLGWWLAFGRGLGPRGLWWGLVAGLALVSFVLLARVRSRLRRALERVRIEDEHPG